MKRFGGLSSEMRALVAISVLCDGADAPEILALDRKLGTELSEACQELLSFDPDVRLAVVSTELRDALAGLVR